MSHITYNEFKNRFGDLGITKYTKAMWLEEGCEEIGVFKITSDTLIGSRTSSGRMLWTFTISDMPPMSSNLDIVPIYIYDYNSTNYNTGWISGDISYEQIGTSSVVIIDNRFSTVEEFKAAMKDKVILYRKKGYVFLNDWTMKNDVKEITIPLSSRIRIDMKYDLTATGSLATAPWLLSIRRNNSGLQNITTPEVIDSKSYRTIKTNESGIDAVRINTETGAIASGRIASIIIHYTEITEVVINPAIKKEGE